MTQIDVRTYDVKGASCPDRMKAAFFIGAMIGITIGGLYGGSAMFRHGIRGSDAVKQVGRTMLNVGASFGVFMTIGTAIRC